MSVMRDDERWRETIGRQLPPGPWFRVDQPLIDRFADLTGDRQFIHVDAERAKHTPYGTTVAHGLLTLSLLPRLLEGIPFGPGDIAMGVNYGFERVRFLAPVRSGSEIRARLTLTRVSERPDGALLLELSVEVEIRGETVPALICKWLVLCWRDSPVGEDEHDRTV